MALLKPGRLQPWTRPLASHEERAAGGYGSLTAACLRDLASVQASKGGMATADDVDSLVEA